MALPLGGRSAIDSGTAGRFLVGVLAFATASSLAAVATSFDSWSCRESSRPRAGPSSRRAPQRSSARRRPAISRAPPSAVRPPDRHERGPRTVHRRAARGRVRVALAVRAGGAARRVRRPVRRAPGEDRGPPLDHEAQPDRRPGLVLLGGAIVAFLIALRGGDLQAGRPSPWCRSWRSSRSSSCGDNPAVDPRLLLHRPFATALAGVFGGTVILHGSFILVPLAEELLGASATVSGIALLGLAGLGAIVAPFGGRVRPPRKARWWLPDRRSARWGSRCWPCRERPDRS